MKKFFLFLAILNFVIFSLDLVFDYDDITVYWWIGAIFNYLLFRFEETEEKIRK